MIIFSTNDAEVIWYSYKKKRKKIKSIAHTNIKFNSRWIIGLTIKPKARKHFTITEENLHYLVLGKDFLEKHEEYKQQEKK